jgi:two-component system, LuxR family, sensor kinase FixL
VPFRIGFGTVNRNEEKIEPLFAPPLPSLNEVVPEGSSHEWMHLGQELHDSVGQLLSGVTFLSRALENKLSARGLPEASDAAEIGHLVFQALTQTRNLARGLFPVELEADGLVEALTEWAGTLEKLFGISCRVEAEADLVLGDQTVANHLFRLAQEAFNNSLKHGRATEVVIGLRRHTQGAELFIRDNGKGLPVQGTKSDGLGLRIMNYRARRIGGRLSIESTEVGGTLVRCIFPGHLTESKTEKTEFISKQSA